MELNIPRTITYSEPHNSGGETQVQQIQYLQVSKNLFQEEET